MLNWLMGTVVNKWFFGGILVGGALRVLGGEVISVTAGLASGILIIEALRFLIWIFARG